MPSPSQLFAQNTEALAERALREAGYTIVCANWRGGGGEIDRIAWDGTVLVFVEIRSRSEAECGRPEETVGIVKQRRVARAALAYLAAYEPGCVPMVRFDVVGVLVAGDVPRSVEIFRDAFDAGVLAGARQAPFV